MNIEKLILEKKGTLIDVREPYELLNEGSIKNAVNIPLKNIENKIKIINKMEKPLLIFCKSGNRSKKAINILHEYGIKDLYNAVSFKSILEILNKK